MWQVKSGGLVSLRKGEGEKMNDKIPVNRKEIEKILESQESFNAYLEVGGEAGMALGLVNFIFWLEGDEATDEECLELIEKTILYFNHR
jgi:hypothetical protein